MNIKDLFIRNKDVLPPPQKAAAAKTSGKVTKQLWVKCPSCKRMLYELAEEYRFQILAIEVMPDHIHLLLDCKPQFFISDMIKIMKGNLARQLFLSHPELKQELWGGHLWNPSYCAVTVSDRSREQVLAYIEGQKEKEKRK